LWENTYQIAYEQNTKNKLEELQDGTHITRQKQIESRKLGAFKTIFIQEAFGASMIIMGYLLSTYNPTDPSEDPGYLSKKMIEQSLVNVVSWNLECSGIASIVKGLSNISCYKLGQTHRVTKTLNIISELITLPEELVMRELCSIQN
jgi:hypothetical protein